MGLFAGMVAWGWICSPGNSQATNTSSTEEVSAGNWQINSLLSPSNAQLASERRGRVTIYDSLREETVDQALDQQFGRIENMMFVSTRYTADDGSEYADHDCD